MEWFSHPWDFGIRKAKEMLFTGAAFTAAEAERMGFVNKVVPRATLEAETLALAGCRSNPAGAEIIRREAKGNQRHYDADLHREARR